MVRSSLFMHGASADVTSAGKVGAGKNYAYNDPNDLIFVYDRTPHLLLHQSRIVGEVSIRGDDVLDMPDFCGAHGRC